jgi:molecular chaperone DnaK
VCLGFPADIWWKPECPTYCHLCGGFLTRRVGASSPRITSDRMVNDAQGHAVEDRRRHEQVEVRNAANSVAYQAQRQIAEPGVGVPLNEKARAEQLIAEIQQLTKSESADVARLRQLTSDLQQLVYGLASAPHGPTAAGGRPGTTPGGDDVIDAEFRPSM